MEEKHSSYIPTEPIPRSQQQSPMTHPTVADSITRIEQSCRMDNPSRVDQSSQLGQQSAFKGAESETQITENNIDSTIKENTKQDKSSVRKTASTGKVYRLSQIYRKVPIAKEAKKEEVPIWEIKKKPQLTYPIPKPPPSRKADIFKVETAREIDRKAVQVDMETVPDVKSLTVKLTKQYYKDVEKVRAIFAWICSLNLSELDYSRAINEKSPLHVIKEVKDGKSSYPELFATMCKCVDISCQVVSGVAKLDDHDIGDTEIDKNIVTWNAVYVADGWRIVFFQWAFDTFKEDKEKKTQGHNNLTKSTPISSKTGSFKDSGKNGDSSIPKLPAIAQSSAKSKSVKENGHDHPQLHSHTPAFKSNGHQDKRILSVNEYYFLTDPDQFIFRCFPDDDMWQLLGKPFSLEKFLKLPMLSQAFFEHQLKISSRLSAIRKAKNGTCVISIKRMDSINVLLNHSFEMIDSESPDQVMDLDFKNLVAVVHDYRTTHFHMRFPVAGMYGFKVFRGTIKTDSEFLCSFKIDCEEPKIRFEPLPFVPEIGFGPCHVTERVGMKLVSPVTGIVTIRGPDTVDIDFMLKKDIKVIAEMLHHTFSSQDLEKYILLKQHNKDLFIKVGVPRNGEYILRILAKHQRSKKDFINVCNFLLMSEDPKKPRKSFENAGDLMIRQQLMDTLKTSKDPEDVQLSIDRLNKEDLPDDGVMTKAYERLKYLKLAKALRDGINRKNADVLEKAIQDAKLSNMSDKLQNYIREGEKMLQDATNNRVYVLDMNRTTISEVHRYKKAKPVMYDVMKATYMLLGERPESLTTWDKIVYLMRMTSRNSLLFRVKMFDKESVDQSIIEPVSKLLQKHTLEEAKLASSGVGTFFTWASDIVKNTPKIRKATQPKEEQQNHQQSRGDIVLQSEDQNLRTDSKSSSDKSLQLIKSTDTI